FGRDLLEAGYAKVFHPDARVLHSHDYRSLGFLRRYFDEFRGLREVLGYREAAGPLRTLRSIRALCSSDKTWLKRQNVPGLRLPGTWSGPRGSQWLDRGCADECVDRPAVGDRIGRPRRDLHAHRRTRAAWSLVRDLRLRSLWLEQATGCRAATGDPRPFHPR